MNRYPKFGETVEIIPFIGDEFDNNDDKFAIVERFNGDYIYVRTIKSGVLIERCITELKEMSVQPSELIENE